MIKRFGSRLPTSMLLLFSYLKHRQVSPVMDLWTDINLLIKGRTRIWHLRHFRLAISVTIAGNVMGTIEDITITTVTGMVTVTALT